MEEYESDELADDSEDEKKLRSAKRRARSKLRARKHNRTTSHLILPGVIVLVSLFVLSNSLNSPFEVISHFGADNHSFPIITSPAVSSDTEQIQHFLQTSATGTAIEHCQAPLPLPPTNSDQVLNRLGKDEYSNLIVDLCSFSDLEEKDLLERSYADYLEGCDSVIVKGRLRVNVSFWVGIGASQFILSVIRESYKIAFYYTPTSVHLHNNNSALNYSDFVVSAITELLKVGSVVECSFPPVLVNPLSVSVQSNGKKRLILDLKHVNFKKSKIKFEDTKSFLQCLLARPTAWAYSFDIKSGYNHHIKIFESDKEVLGLSWVFQGVTKYFKFTVLPFGFSVGPYIFSKVMRPLVRYWRSKALSIVVYLDDGISAAQSFSKCEEHLLLVRSDLFKSGFVPNKCKCQWVPFQVICWLGIFWEFKNNPIFIPPEKISRIFYEELEVMSCRKLARVTRRIVSCFFFFDHG